MTKGRMGCLIAAGVIGVGCLIWLAQVAKVVIDASKAGLLTEDKSAKYQISRENNLKAIQKALTLAAESDAQFPPAEKWMDTAVIRLKTSDLSEDEAKKKLVVPGTGQGYGYAMNEAFSGKSPDNFKGKGKTVIVYESKQTAWNAHGDPSKDTKPGSKGVTLDGTIVPLGG